MILNKLQIKVLPECVYSWLLHSVVDVGEMGERDRLDGNAGHQFPSCVHWPGAHMATSLFRSIA